MMCNAKDRIAFTYCNSICLEADKELYMSINDTRAISLDTEGRKGENCPHMQKHDNTKDESVDPQFAIMFSFFQ